MARIRSIKPDFWRDEKIADLSHGCMAFFIGIWNFCDDQGKCPLNPRQLSLWMPVFRSKDILTWVRQLSEVGLIQVSACSQWILVTNWKHQRINRPVLPDVKNESIQWLPIGHSVSLHESSVNAQCKDRIGKDRSGEDRIPVGATGKLLPDSPASEKPDDQPDNTTQALIAKYCEAYKARYGVNPPIGGKQAGLARRLVKDLGAVRAIALVETYLRMQDAFFLKRRHDLATFEANLNAVTIFEKTGQTITRRDAESAESSDFYRNQMQRLGGSG